MESTTFRAIKEASDNAIKAAQTAWELMKSAENAYSEAKAKWHTRYEASETLKGLLAIEVQRIADIDGPPQEDPA